MITTELEYEIPMIKEGDKVKGIVLKTVTNGVLLECANGAFSGVILSKEVKNLERNEFNLSPGTELEVEIVDTSIRHEEGYYIVSVSQLLQRDVWVDVIGKFRENKIFTVKPTEANLGGLLVDMYGIKGFVPLSQLAPLHYPRVEDGDQEAIFEKLLELIGEEIEVRIITIDEDDKRVVLSEREALKERKEKLLEDMEVGKTYHGIISGKSSYGFFVTIDQSVEGLVHISEITYGHVNNIDRFGDVGDPMEVKVIGLDNGKISLSCKQLKPDPWSIIPKEYKIGDIIEGQVIRFVPYGVFVKVYEDINGLIHLSEMGLDRGTNLNDVVKLGQMIKAQIILLDPRAKKIGLSIKAMDKTEKKDSSKSEKVKKVEEKSAE